VSRTATYNTTVTWKGEHWGHIVMGNGPEMDFSAPPDAQGHPGVLTPEDAFVAAANTCVMMMFIWAAERYKLKLLSYECRAEGVKMIELDRTETFTEIRMRPVIQIEQGEEAAAAVEARVRRALQSAEKYSLVANSIKSRISIEPEIAIIQESSSSRTEARMLTIKVLGPGCANCQRLEAMVRQAVAQLAVEAEVIKVTEHPEIMKYKILSTPGLVINEKVVSAGRIPDDSEIMTFLANALEAG
jgi:small redox-active disulfide protein 2